MEFETFLQNTGLIITEGSIYERLRREPSVEFDPDLAHATLIYEPSSAQILEQVHRAYLEVGQRHHLPMLALTSTWRANRERIERSRFKGYPVNQDNARFLCEIRDSYGNGPPVFVGGNTGPGGDAYKPEEALAEEDAASFHAYQIEALAETGIDYLQASTLPALSEARGIARAMARTGLPYILSFVIRRNGTLLDGTPLSEAIEAIDATVSRPPAGYFVNCVHPSVFGEALTQGRFDQSSLTTRLLGLQANTSAKSPEELDGLEELEIEKPKRFAASMWQVHERFGISILGGCCGTDNHHIECIALESRAHHQK